MQAFAFTAGRVNRITLNGRVVGSVFEDGAVRYCLLGGLGPSPCSVLPPRSIPRKHWNLWKRPSRRPASCWATWSRTWFYLDELLSWYRAFNQARTQAYSRIKFRSGSLPASTGISGRNPAGTALVAGAWAVQPLDSSARVAEVHSPLQCPAAAYGSSFSRAMEISSPHGRRLLISGTASIAPGGQTLWPGNLRQQIQPTMEVVEVILASRGYGFLGHHPRHRLFQESRRHAGIPGVVRGAGLAFAAVVVTAQCGICREDLSL